MAFFLLCDIIKRKYKNWGKIVQNSLQEQIAKNAEDDKKVVENIFNFDSPKSKNITIQYKPLPENEIENHIKYANKFDLDFNELNDYYIDYDSIEDSKDSTNEVNTSEEYLEKKNNTNKFNYSKNQPKKNKGKFKSTAADFKVKYKTELCKYYEINGYCKYYRTKKCVQFFENGYCPYGNRCQFAHQLTTNIINNPYDRKMTYKKTLETISKFENVENIKELIEKPRLSVFKEIVKNKKTKESYWQIIL